MSDKKTTYLVKDINKKTWQKFRGISLLNGYSSSGECLNKLIELIVSADLKTVENFLSGGRKQ